MCTAYIFVNHKYAQFPQKPEEGIVYPRNEIKDWLWDIMDVLETGHDSSTKAFRVFNHWSISQNSQVNIFIGRTDW